jgi:hypothetical protein
MYFKARVAAALFFVLFISNVHSQQRIFLGHVCQPRNVALKRKESIFIKLKSQALG